MDIKGLYELTKEIKCESFLNEELAKHSSFRIGGMADIFIKPKDIKQLRSVILFCLQNNIIYEVVGNGSNILFNDEGYHGAIINIGKNMEGVSLNNKTQIIAKAGTALGKVAYFAMENSLTGFEFAWGIPGNVGGAVFMNAGAYNGEIKDVIISSRYINKFGKEGEMLKEEMNLGYRTSVYMEKDYFITEAKFELKEGDKEEIKETMKKFMTRRKEKQPLQWPNIGSIFKRPKGNYAGTLIEKCGLKGKMIGGAKVSEKHAGFIINVGGAKSQDVLELISLIRQEVKNQTGYDLEPEIRVI